MDGSSGLSCFHRWHAGGLVTARASRALAVLALLGGVAALPVGRVAQAGQDGPRPSSANEAPESRDDALRSTVEITLEPRAGAPGAASAVVEHTARHAAVLSAYVLSSEFDPRARIEGEDGRALSTDDDGGGGSTPFVQALVTPGLCVTIRVEAESEDGRGRARVVLTESPDDEALIAAARELQASLARLDAARQNDAAEARRLLEATIESYQRVPGASRSAAMNQVLWDIAMKAYGWSEHELAYRAFTATRDYRGFVCPPTHRDVLANDMNLGACAFRLGRLEEAAARFEGVLAIRTATLPADHVELQGARLNVGGLLVKLDRLPEARSALEAAHEVLARTRPEDDGLLQAARVNLAAVERLSGDLLAARSLEQRVVETYERTLAPDHPDLLRAKMNLGATLHALREHEAARSLLEQVVEIRERTLDASHPDLLLARQTLALALDRLGEKLAAQAICESVLAEYSKRFPPWHPECISLRVNLAMLWREAGQLERCRAAIDEAASAAARVLPRDGHETTQLLQNQAVTLAQMRDVPALAECIQKLCRATTARLAAGALVLPPRKAQASAALSDPELAIVLTTTRPDGLLHGLGPSAHELFALIESARCVGLTSARAMSRARGVNARADFVAAREAALAAAEALAAGVRASDAEERVPQLARDKEAAERRLLSIAVESGVPPAPGAAEVARGLREDEALVCYWRYRRTEIAPDGSEQLTPWMLALALDRSGEVSRHELGPIASIESAALAWLRELGLDAEADPRGGAVRAGSGVEVPERSGEELARLIWNPLLARLEGRSRVFVLLDDVLHLVPLDALPAGGRVVGDRTAVIVLASAADVLRRSESLSTPRSLLALGGIDYDSASVTGEQRNAAVEPAFHDWVRSGERRSGFAALPGTDREVRLLEDLFRRSPAAEPARIEVWTGVDASKASFVRHAPGRRYLHLATHGFVSETATAAGAPAERGASTVHGFAPMALAGLALAGSNSPPDHLGRALGILTAEELAALDLSACELVTLSACQTSLGLRYAGQGVASLQTAGLAAGARSTLSSLWRVSDARTTELMAEFYRRVWSDGVPKGRALWEAKSAQRAKGLRKRDWAGWILCGSPD